MSVDKPQQPDWQLTSDDRREALIVLLQGWIDDLKAADLASGDDEFLRALDAERSSNQPLFPVELKGLTW
jgi:hypothetical protein